MVTRFDFENQGLLRKIAADLSRIAAALEKMLELEEGEADGEPSVPPQPQAR